MTDRDNYMLKAMRNPWIWLPASIVLLVLATAFFLVLLNNRGIGLLLLLLLGTAGTLIGTHIIRSKRKLKDIIAKSEYLERYSESIVDLNESEERYHMLFDHAAFPISLADAKTEKLVAFNNITHEIHGYSYDEFKDLTFADLEIVNSPAERQERIKKMLEQGSVIFETRHRTKDGGIIDLLVSSVVVQVGGKTLIQNIGANITNLKRTQNALSKSEERFRRLVEYIPDSLFLHDMDGKILDANHSACESLGYTREELIGLYIQDIDEEFILDKHLKSFKEMDPGVPITFEGLQKRKDGTTIPAEIRLLIFESDERQLILALVRNIAARKRAEEDRKKLETQLAYAQKMQAIGTLAGGIAHNFNNLLMGIQGNISLMSIDKGPDDPDFARLNNIQKLIDSGAKLTGQLLGYAREGKYETRPVSLNRLVKETASTFGAARKEISIHYDLDDSIYLVNADQGQIEQALLNLYVNAAEAMPGGGELFLKTANASHRVMKGRPYTPAPGKYVQITISDTGTGIDKEIIERVFDPFFTTKGFAQGTGLGLASVYGIIKSHGGYIEVESERGEGTRFIIHLPATKEVIKKEKERSDEILTGKETILLVDDEELVIEAGQHMLENMGYNVLLAKNGRDALEQFMGKKDKIDLVLLDMVMPDMGGGETYNRMKKINPNVKVLLSSGYGLDGEAKEILERGCNGFIQKPFKMKDLSEKVREVLTA